MRFSLKQLFGVPALAGAAASFAMVLPLLSPALSGCSSGYSGVKTGTPEYWHSRRVRPGGKKPAENRTAQAASPAVSSGGAPLYGESDVSGETALVQDQAAAPVTPAPQHKGAAWPKAVPASQAAAPVEERRVQPAPSPARAAAPAASRSGGGSYTVQPGDTLYSIAASSGFLFDWHYLAKKNGISAPYSLSAGQVIDVSNSCGRCSVHIVRPGDTLYSVSRTYGKSPAEIAGKNGISTDSGLKVGQYLIIESDR